MLCLSFFLFYESSEVWKEVSADGRVGVWTDEGEDEGCEDEGRVRFGIVPKAQERVSAYEVFLLSEDYMECLLL